ncbi:longevity-assurance (LAG1) domain-containing protein, putative [Eimeria mitis]|uniref:Longevity-assurance (LAG1) domain-containing protein, putative n=1 Tax=Eimeria mitis TaxID=44415 RepID=U6KH87_9EIME|nr:longevity-assurance (LAG1) domain-containing protein, putative [Eimeria mitis]CDJ36156.1 longevity-assurance (LAG1) domain-containing protein, putative [Eimeria mitis]
MVRLDRVFGILLAVIAFWSALHYPKVAGSIRHRLGVPGGGYPDPSDLRIYGAAAAAFYLVLQPMERAGATTTLLSFRGNDLEDVVLFNDYSGYPMQQNSIYCHLYFYVAFGHHLATLIYILKSPWLPDFFDQLLPCVSALCLIYFSYMSNFLRVGVVILFCHDICDIFTFGCKAFVDTPYHKVTIGLFVLLTSCWFYFRLYTFPSAALFPIFKAIKTRPDNSETESSSYFIFILLTLSLMNIYWFVLMVKMFVHFILSGQMRDLHSRVSEVDSSGQPRDRLDVKPSKVE